MPKAGINAQLGRGNQYKKLNRIGDVKPCRHLENVDVYEDFKD
jgi:hypothetical protein